MTNTVPSKSGKWSKFALALGLLLVMGGALLYSAYSSGLFALLMPEPETVVVDQRPPVPEKPKTVDHAMMFARIKEPDRLAYAQAVEKATLEEYDRRNAADSPGYASGRAAARLYAFLVAEGDSYGEGLLFNVDRHALAAFKEGCRDPIIKAIRDAYEYENHFSNCLDMGQKHLASTEALLATDYPPVIKFEVLGLTMKNLTTMADQPDRMHDDVSACLAELPPTFDKAMQAFADFLQTAPPRTVLYWKINTYLDRIDDSYDYLDRSGVKMDEILAAANASGAVRAYTQGNCQIQLAWAARGSGWANSVTDDGWRKMADHLKKAETILDPASDAYPDVPNLSALMITVELGQGVGQYRMDQWFKKSVAIDPDYRRPYCSKIYYLQPKWHGSSKEVVKFARECIASGRWESGVPLAGLDGISDLAEYEEDIYGEPVLWDMASKGYEEWLRRYPESVHSRTKYFLWAVKAQKWDIARAQLKALGPWWDRFVLNDAEYTEFKNAIPPGNS